MFGRLAMNRTLSLGRLGGGHAGGLVDSRKWLKMVSTLSGLMFQVAGVRPGGVRSRGMSGKISESARRRWPLGLLGGPGGGLRSCGESDPVERTRTLRCILPWCAIWARRDLSLSVGGALGVALGAAGSGGSTSGSGLHGWLHVARYRALSAWHGARRTRPWSMARWAARGSSEGSGFRLGKHERSVAAWVSLFILASVAVAWAALVLVLPAGPGAGAVGGGSAGWALAGDAGRGMLTMVAMVAVEGGGGAPGGWAGSLSVAGRPGRGPGRLRGCHWRCGA